MGGKYSSPFLALTAVFVVLKLLKIITWSWTWALAPFWIPTLIVIIVFFITAAIINGKEEK